MTNSPQPKTVVPSPQGKETEEWRPAPGFEQFYKVSSLGRVMSLRTGRIRKDAPDHRGYRFVELRGDGVKKNWKVHALVLTAFVGPRPPEAEGCHWNGVRSDNRLTNLRWATHIENMRDAIELGTIARGTRSGTAKMTEETVLELRRLRLGGMAFVALGRKYGISDVAARLIATGQVWGHVPMPSPPTEPGVHDV